MGFLDEYNKALEEEKKKKKKSTGNKSSYLETYRDTLATMDREETAPITTRATKEKKDERKWFDSGAFEDGYQFGDILKTTTGTIKDLRENLVAGVLGIGEATVDAGAYIAGGVGKLFGADKFADKTKDFISKELVNEEKVAKAIVRGTTSPFLDPTRKHDTDDISILGEKSDSLVQSGGQLLGTMGLQAAGVPWFVTTGVISFGSEAENAFRQGAGYGEAGLSAAVSAGAEILTEKLFGGSGLGEKGLINLDGLTKGISNKLVKVLADHGVDMAAEGFEEVFSQVASNLGTSLYKEENLGELLLSEEAIDSYLESFVGGAALGGVANVGKVTNSIQTGRDYRTGMTENEQKVFDKVYADAIAEAEQDGKKLTKNEKAKIYDEVVEQMEKGYISTDTIEEVLGGDTYKSYRDTVDSEDSILKEFEELGKKQNATLAEQARYNELSQQVKEIRENSKRNEFKTKLGEEVSSLVQNERLGESYAERNRRGQAFAADLSKYDKKQQQTIQKAIDSGILNNTNRTHEFVDMVAKITADKGVPFDFTNNQKLKESGFAVDGKTVNGYVTKDGIAVNINSSKSLNSIVGHEITHVLEGTDIYTELQSAIVEYAKSKGDYQGRYDSLSKLYQNIEGANIDAELTADLVGDYLFTDSDFVRNLSVKHRNVFQKIWDEVKYLAKVATAGSKEAKELAKVQRAFEKAYREAGNAKGDTKYSLDMVDAVQPKSDKWSRTHTTEEAMAKFPNMWNVAAEESEVRNPTQITSTVNSYRKIYNFLQNEGFNGTILDASSGLGYGTRAGVEEYGFNVEDIEPYPDKGYNPKYQDYSALDKKYDVIISNAVLNVLPQDQRDALAIKMGELLNDGGRLFVNVRGKDVESLAKTGKNIHLGNMEWIETVKGSYQKGFTKPELVAYLQDALGDGFTVKPTNMFGAVSAVVTKDGVKYSLSDSDGKQLTKEQQEYFKDSKMRDEKGNLKVMYHGSRDAGFHVFDAKMSDDNTSFFFVDRNDVAASYSGTTETYEAKTIRTAEDMNKFLAEIGQDEDYSVTEQDGQFILLYDGERVAASDTAPGIYKEFCWYEGVGEGDANYKVYLNLTNPLVVDAEGRNWDEVSREFSQEIADKYKTLTEEEKATLHDLAGWEDIGMFRHELNKALDIVESRGGGDGYTRRLASAYQKLGEDINMYDLFSIAEDNFSDLAIEAWAVKQMNTRDYAQKAKAEGYDGVIFKNIVDVGGYGGDYTPSTVAIAFESSQIKSVANGEPTKDADIRYSLSDSEGNKLSNEQVEYFQNSKIRDAAGNLKVMHHGSGEAFTVFDRKKAKSSGYYGSGFYFTDSDSHAKQYGNTYDVYLNITNPLQDGAKDISKEQLRKFVEAIAENEDYGIENYGYGATVDSVTDSVYGKSDFAMIMDINASCVGNMVEAIELFNEVNGTEYNGIVAATETVAFYPEQIKRTDNTHPTSDSDIRFSLSEPVEQTKDLMAIHNLTEEKLLKSLRLGGLPMPSVAIAKAKDGHGEFGEISLVLPKETIDPKASSRNKLYSGDAWTPTYPNVEYKVNEKVLSKIESKLTGLVPSNILHDLGRISLDTDNMTDKLNRHGGDVVDAFKSNDALKYAYLVDNGADITLPMKEKRISYGSRENGEIIRVAEAIPADEIKQALNGASAEMRKLEPRVRQAVTEYWQDTYGDDPVALDVLVPKEELSFSELDGYLSDAMRYHRNGVERTVDSRAAKTAIADQTIQTEYEKWLEQTFSGIVEKEGLRNNKDYFTPAGNRRSFEALHYEHNLENVIKAMREKGEKGIGGFGGGSIFGAATTEFSSVEDMKQASDRLQMMSQEEYQAMRDEFSNRFFQIAGRLPNDKRSFMATDDAANVLVEAVAKYNTRSGIANYLRKELKGWATYSDQAVDDLIELVRDIRNMPTGYFEAKPQRAVGFDEVGVFIIPNDASAKLKQELLNGGYAIAEYDPKVEGDRTRVLNQFEEYMFSLSDVGQQHRKYGSWNVYGKDIRLNSDDLAPFASNATAPVSEATVAENATVAPVGVAENETPTEDLFPSITPVESEIEQIQGEMDTLTEWFNQNGYTSETAKEYQRKTERYLDLEAKLAELEQQQKAADDERLGTLSDADVPPEKEAPYYEDAPQENAPDPFAERDWYEVGNRKEKAYMYEHPEVKPFFQEMAGIISWDLGDTTKAERWYNDELHYASGGEKGFGGNKRHTSRQIETMLDEWGMSYADIEKGLNAIIEDNGAENIAAAKKIEFMLNDMLLNGYQDFHTGKMVEPNQEYIKLLNDMQITDYSKEAFDALMANADKYAPVADEVISKKETTTPLAKATPDTMDAPIYESKEKDAVKGQTTMFEPPKPNPKVAKVLTEETEIAKKKSGIGSKLVSALVDKGMVFENLSLETGNMRLQSKYNYALPSNTEARAQYLMENGDKGVKSLKDIKARVEKSGKTDQFYDYLYHVHNIDRMTLADRFMDTPNKPVFGETVTAAESKKKVAQYEKTNPEFKALAEDVYAYNRHLRKMLADSGVISRKTAALWQKMYPHYVPIRRVDTQGQNISVPLDSKKTGVNNPVKRATGGSSDIMPLFETMAQRTEQTFRAIARNSFGIELKNTLGTTIGTQEANVDEVIDTIGAQEELLKPGTTTSQPTFTVFENGEKVEFEITEDMFNALKPAEGILGYRNKVVQKVGDARRNLLTVWNPVFALYRNPIKDIQDVAINSQHAAKTYANIPNAIYQLATNGEYATEYHKNGGKSNTYFDSRTNKFKAEDNLFKKIIGMPVRAIENAGEFIEEIPRLAEYIASRQEGRSVERSMLDAARVTTNFAAGGDFTKFLNSHGFTFLNASVQGASQHVRNFREAKQEGLKGYVKVLAKYAVAGLPTILLNSMLWDDDEEYEELSDYVKQNYYVIAKTEDGKFVRIPKGRTAAVIGELMNQMENLVTGDDEADFSTFFELFMNNIAPNNPIENNILAPILQVKNNEAWYGGDLVPSRLQDLPAEEQYDESTDSISKWLGEKTGTSPYKWNYLIDQYSGGLGDVFLPMLTPEAESGDNSLVGNILAPWKKEVTTDKVLNNKYPGDFYDLKDELDKKANSSKATEEDTMRSMFMQSVSWDMSDLYKQKREIQGSDLSDAEKYEAVREIQEQINALAESGLNGYNDVSIMGKYSEVGDRRYNYDEENGKWYEIQETNADGTANYYYEKEQEVTKGLGISYEQYWNNREEYNYAYDKPEQYQLARAVGGYQAYRGYTSELWDIKADKDENGKSISGSRKEKVIDYLNNLDADYYTKIMLFKNEYNADDTYNAEIVEYLNGRDDISYDDMVTILKYLGFEVSEDGTKVYW